MATKKRQSKSPVKATVKRRSLNVGGSKPSGGEPFNNQDVKRRLGNFEGAGEHPRTGGRNSGIVGQTTKQFRTQNRKTKS